jgi:hypothetical protein
MVPWGVGALPIQKFLRECAFAEEDIDRLTKAHARALLIVGIKDRNDVLSELIAKKIIEIGQAGSN